MCSMERTINWENYLYLVEFAYNNTIHSSMGMSPFEALYDKRCNTPLGWNNLEDKHILGPEMLQEME